MLLPLVATLFGRLPRWHNGDDRPPTLDAHIAVGHFFIGLDEVGSTWILPFNLTYNYVPARKGEHFGKCIVKKQKGGGQCDKQYDGRR